LRRERLITTQVLVQETAASGGNLAVDWLQTRLSSVATIESNEVTSTEDTRCTAGCTGEAVPDGELDDDALADFVARLSPEHRRRLADLLAAFDREERRAV
jgi:hypothetical protein